MQPKISRIDNKPKSVLIPAIICFLFAIILYSNTFKHSYVLDDSNIKNNWVVKKGISGIPIIIKSTYWYGINNLNDNLYRPFSQIMFAIEWQISPNNPSLSHIMNVLFYALSCLLLFIVLRKYMSKAHPIIPFVITLLYVAHPIHTEVVANIKGRDEIMSFFFLMLSLLSLHCWFAKSKWWSLIVALLMFFLALLSKEGVITMIFIFPVIGWYFTEAKPKTILVTSLFLITPALAYIIIRHQIIDKNSLHSTISVVENLLVGAPDTVTHFATAVMILGKYLLLSLVPYQLVCDYGFSQIPYVGLSSTGFMLSMLVFIALFVYVIINFQKKSPLVFGLLFFLITMSMYSNILFHIGTSFGERLMFLPSLGLCIAFVCAIAGIMKIMANSSIIGALKSKPLFTILLIIILTTFSFKTIVRAAEWKNETILFGTDIKRSPKSVHLFMWSGNSLFEKAEGEHDKSNKDNLMLQSLQQMKEGLVIYPDYVRCYSQMSLIYLELGNKKEAINCANIAVKVDSTDVIKWYNIGLFYERIGDFQKAIQFQNKATSLRPDYSEAYNDRGFAKYSLKDYKGAIADYDLAIAYNPDFDICYDNRGSAKYYLHYYNEAIADYNKAIKINHTYADAYSNRGITKLQLKDYDGAIADYNMVLEINPGNSDAYLNIGSILGETGKYEEAIYNFKKCIELNPGNFMVCQYIGMCYQSLKQKDEAKIWFEKAQLIQQQKQ